MRGPCRAAVRAKWVVVKHRVALRRCFVFLAARGKRQEAPTVTSTLERTDRARVPPHKAMKQRAKNFATQEAAELVPTLVPSNPHRRWTSLSPTTRSFRPQTPQPSNTGRAATQAPRAKESVWACAHRYTGVGTCVIPPSTRVAISLAWLLCSGPPTMCVSRCSRCRLEARPASSPLVGACRRTSSASPPQPTPSELWREPRLSPLPPPTRQGSTPLASHEAATSLKMLIARMFLSVIVSTTGAWGYAE